MDTRSLLYFIAVAEEQNIGRAAARLHITQPALTRQIQSLEDELGSQLFRRTTNGMEITPAGVALLAHARNIQAEMAAARVSVREADTSAPLPINIGVYGSSIFSVIPQVLQLFHEKHPETEFILHNIRKDQQVEFLRQGKILISFDRYLPVERDMAYEIVYREQLYVALHKDHPLAGCESIDMKQLVNETRIGANFDNNLDTSISALFGLSGPMRHKADDMLTTLALVSRGLGITFAPPSIRALAIPNVVYRPYSGAPVVPFDVQCMYRKNEASPHLQSILQIVRDFSASAPDLG